MREGTILSQQDALCAGAITRLAQRFEATFCLQIAFSHTSSYNACAGSIHAGGIPAARRVAGIGVTVGAMVVAADVTNGVFALLGVLLGSVLASVWAYVSERRERRAALYVAAYACLTRWNKVMAAYKTKPGSVQDEVIRLGRDLDDYMVAIPRVPDRRERKRHADIYTEMVTIFSRQDLTVTPSPEIEDEIRTAIRPLEADIREEFGRTPFPARLLGRGDETAKRLADERAKAESEAGAS